MGHSHPECHTTDIYLIDDPNKIQAIFSQAPKPPEPAPAYKKEAIMMVHAALAFQQAHR